MPCLASRRARRSVAEKSAPRRSARHERTFRRTSFGSLSGTYWRWPSRESMRGAGMVCMSWQPTPPGPRRHVLNVLRVVAGNGQHLTLADVHSPQTECRFWDGQLPFSMLQARKAPFPTNDQQVPQAEFHLRRCGRSIFSSRNTPVSKVIRVLEKNRKEH